VFESEIVKKFSKAQDSLVIQQSDFSLSAINEMVENNSIDVAPHYQRRDRWKPEKQSALIESFLINVPVPPIYLSEDEYGSYSVIDGKQRITAIRDFLSGNLKLRDMKEFPELSGSLFDDLPKQLKSVLMVRPFIRVITLLKQSDPELKYEVFLRLNTGGERLKQQEIRNVAYSGKLNDLLIELSESEFLRRKLKITSAKSTAYRNMDDVEHVLRYLTLLERWKDMSRKLTTEMDVFMAKNRNCETAKYRKSFSTALENCEDIWGEKAFQKPVGDGWREQLISPLYDAQMVAISTLSAAKINSLKGKRQTVIRATRRLFENDEEFVKSITQSTNNASSIQKRVNGIISMLKSIGD
jgi:hypothetical protein